MRVSSYFLLYREHEQILAIHSWSRLSQVARDYGVGRECEDYGFSLNGGDGRRDLSGNPRDEIWHDKNTLVGWIGLLEDSHE